jgi:hypothetical protein
MPDEIAKSTGGTYRMDIILLWKLPQHPARKLANEVAQFVERAVHWAKVNRHAPCADIGGTDL